MNDEAKILQNHLRKWQSLSRIAPQIVGRKARSMFLESFKNQGYFSDSGLVVKWPTRGAGPQNRKNRALLVKTGQLKRSIQFESFGKKIVISTNEPQAKLMNDGGIVPITPKMRRFFWAQYHQAGGDNEGKPTADAKFWLNMAFHKGKTITIKSRPFIYDTNQLVQRLNKVFETKIKEIYEK